MKKKVLFGMLVLGLLIFLAYVLVVAAVDYFISSSGSNYYDHVVWETSLNGTTATDQFGVSVASGDVNGDGYKDVIVGANLANPSGAADAGQAYVFFGTANGISDMDASNANITLNGTAANDYFGVSVGSGNVNNDGYADVIVGANGVSSSAGQAYVFFGADYPNAVGINYNANQDANLTFNGTTASDKFGYSVGSGDVNNDSYADVIVGAYQADPSGVGNAGQAFVFFGANYTAAVNEDASSYANITLNGTLTADGGAFGYSVGSGDVNNDSYADVIVGASDAEMPIGTKAGQAFVFFGADYTSAVNENAAIYANITLNGTLTADGGAFGQSVGSGDVNNDSYADVIVGAYIADPSGAGDAGQAFVFFGAEYPNTAGINYNATEDANLTFNGTTASDYFGWSVASGDVNNDSYADVIVGAYIADPPDAENAGQVYIFDYDDTNPVVILDGPSSGSSDTDGEVSFTFTATDSHPGVCSLYINTTLSDWAINASVSYSSNIQGSIAVNLTDATYTWSMECNDTVGKSAFNDTNYTITVTNSAPSVTLNSPSDNSYDTDGLDVVFNFTATENYPERCTLFFRSNATNWEQNETIEYSSNTQHNFSSVNLTDAAYVWNVECNDTANNPAFASANRTVTVDTTVPTTPTVTEPSDTSINPRDSISYTCDSTDVTAGINSWAWTLTKPQSGGTVTKTGGAVTSNSQSFSGDETNLAGDYTVVCEAEDKAGHKSSSSSKTFTVYYSHAAEAGTGEGSASAADIDLSTAEELTITEKQGTITTFTLDGTTVHTIKIKTVDEVAGTVTIIIESDPITITLKIGETEEVDVDADGTNDISVTLNGITKGVADITTKRLTPLPKEEVPTEEVPPTEKPAEEITPEAPSKAWQWILVIVILVVIGAGYYFMKKRK